MPQKSQYIQAPITKAKLVKGLKDGLSFFGVEVNQTDLSNNKVYDGDFINSLLTTSSVNLVSESEILSSTEVLTSGGDLSKSLVGPIGHGCDIYVEPNTDNSVPFKNTTVIKPRYRDRNVYASYNFTTNTNTQYTFSFWVSKGQVTTDSILTIFALNGATVLASKAVTVTDNFTRQFITFTATGTTTSISIGGKHTWAGSSIGHYFATETFPSWTVPAITGTTDSLLTYDINTLPEPQRVYATSLKDYDPVFRRLVFTTVNSGIRIDYLPDARPIAAHTADVTFKFTAKVNGSVNARVTNSAAFPASTGSTIMSFTDTASAIQEFSFTVPTAIFATSYAYLSFWAVSANSSIDIYDFQVVPSGITSVPFMGFVNPTSSSHIESYYETRILTYSTSGRYTGDLKFSGFQLNTGNTVLPYEPVRSWLFQPSATGVQSITWEPSGAASILILQTHVPTGVRVVLNSLDSNYKIVGAIANHNEATYRTDTTSTYNLAAARSYTTGGGFTNGYAYTNTTIYYGSRGPNYGYASSALRACAAWGMSPNVWTLRGYAPAALGAGTPTNLQPAFAKGVSDNLLLRVNGYIFKPNPNNVAFIGTHIKTAGQGRRKFVDYAVREDATNFYIYPTVSLVQTTGELRGRGVLEQSYGLSTDTAEYTFAPEDQANMSWPTGVTRRHVIPKSTDLFIFSEGAADGFVLATNSGSGFNMLVGFFDLDNAPFPGDDGTQYTRHAYLILNNNNTFTLTAHTPTKFNTYFVGNSPVLGTNSFMDLAEVYGEDATALNTDLVYPAFLENSNNENVVNRGRMKNLYISKASLMAGAVGDILITKDNTKYFTIFKDGASALYMKV